MIVKPPIGNPDAKKDEYWLLKRTLYGLCCSPHHWYPKIKGILNSLGLNDNSSDPCLFTGNLINPSNPMVEPSLVPLTLGIYVNDFAYFLEDPQGQTLLRRTPHRSRHGRFHGDRGLVSWHSLSVVFIPQQCIGSYESNRLCRAPC